jgi:hypothetical protein
VLEVGVSGSPEVSYFLRLDDGELVGLDLGHIQETTWPGSEEPIQWRSAGGSRVLVHGTKEKSGRISVDRMEPPSSPIGTTSSALATSGVGKRRLLAVQVRPGGHAPSWSTSQVQAALAGAEARLAEYSFGKMTLTHDLVGPLDLTKGSCDDAYGWMNDARAQLQAQGQNPDTYDHLMLIGDFACPWAGLGMQPGNGTWIAVPDAGVIVHELGHNLGLWHASSLTCAKGMKPMDDPSHCTQDEYGDPFDPMGWGGGDKHYNGRAKVDLGWIPAANTAMASGDQTYTLTPITQQNSGLQLLGVKGPKDIVYQIEYRQPTKYNTMSAGAPERQGVLIHAFFTQAGDSARARLLDMVPTGVVQNAFLDAALTVGNSYTFYGTSTTITVESASPTGAVVHISDGGDGGDGGEAKNLKPLHSGKCIGVAGASKVNGARVVQWHCNGSTDQQWTIEDAGKGQVQVRDVNSGKCLQVEQASLADGAKIRQRDCNGAAAQLWKTSDNADGTKTFRSVLSDKCLDVYGGSTADGANVIQWSCHGGNNQRFQIQ